MYNTARSQRQCNRRWESAIAVTRLLSWLVEQRVDESFMKGVFMAERPVFVASETGYVRTVLTEFTFCSGFARVQKQRSIDNLHTAYQLWHPGEKVLEVSRYSKEMLGKDLSAFNLTITLKDGRKVPVENAYQAGKVFQYGGPFLDLLDVSPGDAKTDARLQENGPIIGFSFDGVSYPTKPESFFYTSLYLRGLFEHPELADPLMEYTAFTDIVFNPAKSISCQAKVAALYVSLRKKGELEKAISDPDFLKAVLSPAGRSTAKQPGDRMTSSEKTAALAGKSPDTEAQAAILTVGQKVGHPSFGEGIVKAIRYGSGSSSIAEVDFGKNGIKKLSVDWIIKSCRV